MTEIWKVLPICTKYMVSNKAQVKQLERTDPSGRVRKENSGIVGGLLR